MYTTQVTLSLCFRHGFAELYIHFVIGGEKLWCLTLKTENVIYLPVMHAGLVLLGQSLVSFVVYSDRKSHLTCSAKLRDSGTKVEI